MRCSFLTRHDQYPEATSHRLSIVEFPSSSNTSCVFTKGSASCFRNGFTVAVKLTQNLHFESFFLTSTTGADHGESLYSTIPFSSITWHSSLIISFSAGEYLLYLHLRGVTFGSFSSNVNSTPFIIPGLLGSVAATLWNTYSSLAMSSLVSIGVRGPNLI